MAQVKTACKDKSWSLLGVAISDDEKAFKVFDLLVEPLLLAGLDLGNGDVLLPVVCPVELTLQKMLGIIYRCFLMPYF